MRPRLNGSRVRRAVAAIGGLLGRTTGNRRRPPRTAVPEEHVTVAPPDAAIGDVRFSYVPCLDGDPDPGEVVWAWVSYEEDPTLGKDRPVVIVGRAGPMLAAVALTTKGRDDPDNVFVGTGPWDPAGRDSWAKLDRIVRIDPAAMRREGAVLDRRRFDTLTVALQRRTSR